MCWVSAVVWIPALYSEHSGGLGGETAGASVDVSGIVGDVARGGAGAFGHLEDFGTAAFRGCLENISSLVRTSTEYSIDSYLFLEPFNQPSHLPQNTTSPLQRRHRHPP
jgi:hypothetical protein